MASYKNLKGYEEDPNYTDKEKWISSRLLTLRHDLYEEITKDRQPNSLIIGSWNIKAFDNGKPRMDESYHYIAEIIDHFDICAIQEIKKDLKPLEKLTKLLGPNWTYFVSDVSTHKGGNNERMAFVYNENRVRFKNLIGEIVLPTEDLIAGNQIARSPFFASFQAGWFKFSLCSAHIIYGDNLESRAAEIGAVAKVLVKRAKDEDQVHLFIGDMNIESNDDIVMQALVKSGMNVPEFGATNLGGNRYFDKIAFTEDGKAKNKTRLIRNNIFDWRHAVYGPHPSKEAPPFSNQEISNGKSRLSKQDNLNHYKPHVDRLRSEYNEKPYKNWSRSYKNWTTLEMSDHLPIWIELEIDYSDDYLRKYLG